jgi:hypothetical protein
VSSSADVANSTEVARRPGAAVATPPCPPCPPSGCPASAAAAAARALSSSDAARSTSPPTCPPPSRARHAALSCSLQSVCHVVQGVHRPRLPPPATPLGPGRPPSTSRRCRTTARAPQPVADTRHQPHPPPPSAYQGHVPHANGNTQWHCIGLPWLRPCVHGAPIGGRRCLSGAGGDGSQWRRRRRGECAGACAASAARGAHTVASPPQLPSSRSASPSGTLPRGLRNNGRVVRGGRVLSVSC